MNENLQICEKYIQKDQNNNFYQKYLEIKQNYIFEKKDDKNIFFN